MGVVAVLERVLNQKITNGNLYTTHLPASVLWSEKSGWVWSVILGRPQRRGGGWSSQGKICVQSKISAALEIDRIARAGIPIDRVAKT